MGASKSEYRKAMLYVPKVLCENLGSEIYVLIEIVMVFLSPHVQCHGSSSNEIIMASVHIIGNAFFTNKHITGRAMAQVVIRRPLTVEARVRTRFSPCGICGGQSDTGADFSLTLILFPCQYHSPYSISGG
jgi:hypothetical protein